MSDRSVSVSLVVRTAWRLTAIEPSSFSRSSYLVGPSDSAPNSTVSARRCSVSSHVIVRL
jgi:hypothetical protein